MNALGVVRSLALGRMPIYLLDPSRGCPTAWSRFSHFVRIPSLDGAPFIAALIELAKRLGCRPVLVLTSDQCVDAVSAAREQLEPWYRFSLPDDKTVRALADKTLFQGLAEQLRFEVPRAVCLASVADLDRLSEVKPPLVVKPGDKTLVLRGLVERAVRCESLDEARSACARMLATAPSLIVQEWIDGPDSALLFTLFACDGQGKLLGAFHGRKLLCDPPGVGSTAICRGAPEMAAALIGPTRQFIDQVGYRGLGSLEFKQDATRNRLAIIEPTVGRTDWQSEIATLGGINLPLLLYRSELGDAPPPPPPQAPAAWRSSAGHRLARSGGTQVVDGYFRWEDPLPAIYYYLYERGWLRVWNRLRRAVRNARPGSGTRS